MVAYISGASSSGCSEYLLLHITRCIFTYRHTSIPSLLASNILVNKEIGSLNIPHVYNHGRIAFKIQQLFIVSRFITIESLHPGKSQNFCHGN